MGSPPPHLKLEEVLRSDATRTEYRGTQQPLGRPVLIIGLASGAVESSPSARALRSEADVLSRLDHPNIARLLEFQETGRGVWLVLEDLAGVLLEELAPRQPRWEAVASIGLDVCRALAHAHELGMTHGGLEPRSVVITKAGRTKLCGFGQRGIADARANEPLEIVAHRSLTPETSLGQAHTPLSDLFALGAVLYEAASGEPPFGAPDSLHYAAQVRNQAPPPLERRRPDLPRPLASLIDRLLSKLPADRPATARGVALELEALVGSATVPNILNELIRLELTDQTELPTEARDVVDSPRRRHSAMRWSTVGMALAFSALGLVLGAFWNRPAPDPATTSAVVVADGAKQGSFLHLRVVADPWAHVFVDGQQLETTPFAYPLPLSPGAHVVRLEHPHAPPEERTIEGQAGQVVLLNVQMHVRQPLPSPTEAPEFQESTP